MRPRSLSELAAALEGELHGRDALASSVVTDSRLATPGSLFFALRGEHADGHEFVGDALGRGAVGAVVARPIGAGPHVVVPDPGAALLALAALERGEMTGTTVLGITGANGKTSTKDFAASVLGTRFRTHASPASFNNEIGLPLTVLGAPANTEVLVAEMGARRAGDVAKLCEIARPHAVVVTNVGVAHMEVFGSWEAIVEASAEPVDALPHTGVAILSADDPVVRGYRARTRARVLTFGVDGTADVRAQDLRLDDAGRASFDLVWESDRARVELEVPGEHMVQNALAASACGLALGISVEECAIALKDARVSHWRMETFTTAAGVVVVNDAYNANPDSMAAGLRTARWMARTGRLAAVLGHMAELGPISQDAHERLGELVVRIGVERLVTVGEQASAIARAAIREGALPEDVAVYDSADEAARDVRAWARAGDVVLVKGSRVAGLERVAEALR
ncbi:MAG TPA: UDP-N-acetylmuramoyl-tripeptide--D-alanyl-D-alanine ligase [Actinomycetota bacterium]|nr:UDP-N-acetylmuramoyl-tripeptide--D-alanyl-D-alanine ligase [Actinomycetota bacterium]